MKSSFIIIMFSPLATFIPSNTAGTFALTVLTNFMQILLFLFFRACKSFIRLIEIFFAPSSLHPILLSQIHFLQVIFP